MNRMEAVMTGNLEPLCDLIVERLLERLRGDGGRNLSPAPAPEKDAVLVLEEAASRLQHGYHWLSRNYRKLGLRPSRIGGKLLFREKDVNALITREKLCFRGRPKKKGTFSTAVQ